MRYLIMILVKLAVRLNEFKNAILVFWAICFWQVAFLFCDKFDCVLMGLHGF